MKKRIHASTKVQELVGNIDLVIIANDARTLTIGSLPIVASSDSSGYSKDFDQFSVEEIMDLDDSELRNLTSLYALDVLVEAINNEGFEYTLTKKQKDILSDFYSTNENALIQLSPSEIIEITQMIANCKHVTRPGYRKNQPEKNFADMHGFTMFDEDYLAIVNNITSNEFIRALKSYDRDRLGVPLYEFIHDPKNFKLKSGQIIDSKISIYIKLILEYDSDFNVAIISFHDPSPETLADAN